MKKILLTLAVAGMTLGASAQEKGRFEVHDLGNFKLHVYYTNDALGDASYVAEFDAYLSKLGKKVEKRITDYHVGGTGSHDVVMAEGMPEFTKGEIYGGMMAGFAQMFGDALTDMPTGKATEVAFGSTQTWAGIPFEFRRGATSDFPGASILIGSKVYFTHWVPSKSHASHLQISSPAAIDAEIAEARKSLESGAELFIGGHGGAAKADAVQFKIDYLKKMKEVLGDSRTAQDFVDGMKKAYPELPGADGLGELAKVLYK